MVRFFYHFDGRFLLLFAADSHDWIQAAKEAERTKKREQRMAERIALMSGGEPGREAENKVRRELHH